MAEDTPFRQRLRSFQNEQERLRAEREFDERRSRGVEERARRRAAAEAEARRQRVEAEREATRNARQTARAQADVRRFNEPSRIVPRQERVPTAPPAPAVETPRQTLQNPLRTPMTAPGGGGAGQPPTGRAVMAPPGGGPIDLPPLRVGPRLPMSAGAAGAVLGPGLLAADLARDYVARRRAESDALREAARTPVVERDTQLPRRTGPGEDSEEATEQRRVAASETPAAPAAASRPRQAARRRGPSEADRLNEISLALIRGERPQGPEATNIARRMGIEGYKKGGMIKPKAPVKKAAGGMIGKKPAAPKAPGRAAGRPASTVKPFGTRPMAKAAASKKPVPMPAFKKGGKVSAKKGKK